MRRLLLLTLFLLLLPLEGGGQTVTRTVTRWSKTTTTTRRTTITKKTTLTSFRATKTVTLYPRTLTRSATVTRLVPSTTTEIRTQMSTVTSVHTSVSTVPTTVTRTLPPVSVPYFVTQTWYVTETAYLTTTSYSTTTSFFPVTTTSVLTTTVTSPGAACTTPAQTPRTTTSAYSPRTATPTLDPANTIVNPACTYVPVPYVLPREDSTKATVFNIELLRCSPSTEYDATFIRAAQRWMSIITEDVQDVSANMVRLDDCVATYDWAANRWTNAMSCGRIDDLIIGFSVAPIDGPGKILGAANWWYYRDGGANDRLPCTGFMIFDSEDVAALVSTGQFEAVVLHEMGHVLGIGTVWDLKSQLWPSNCWDIISSGGTAFGARYLGPYANASLSLVDPTGSLMLPYVPVHDSPNENSTSCSHWKEASFGRELMTGYISPPRQTNPLSYLTAWSLRDLGYSIDPSSPEIDRDFTLGAQLDMMPGGLHLTHCLDVPKPQGHVGGISM
ncbi:hypothetical protein DFJ74DRAFT_773054 [Hyaloraphidium curvatum]|nr:hypothetical protein DFJ74DRAFT_773054 [Hyaloraphidium curvatum]